MVEPFYPINLFQKEHRFLNICLLSGRPTAQSTGKDDDWKKEDSSR
jgi:hypothetical protein